MYSILGYISSLLLIILISPFILRTLNKKFIGNNKKITEIVKKLKKIHKVAGALVAVIAIIHGYMAMGGFRLHTGSILYISMIISIVFGILFAIKKKKQFLNLHKTFVFITIILWAVHILFPSALYYIMD